MDKSSDPALSKFSKYFYFPEVAGIYSFDYPNSFNSDNGAFGLTQENKENVTFEEKEVFVRYISCRADIELRAVKELGLEVKYYFEEPGFTYDNEFSYTK